MAPVPDSSKVWGYTGNDLYLFNASEEEILFVWRNVKDIDIDNIVVSKNCNIVKCVITKATYHRAVQYKYEVVFYIIHQLMSLGRGVRL